NPFKVPSDTELFSVRDKEIKKAQAEYEKRKTMKVHEKTTYSTKMKAKSRLRRALKREEEEEGRTEATCEERLEALQELLSRKLAMKKDYALDRETFHGYLQDRKQIFFLEYAIAVKREEIEKMQTIAKNEEEKLEKAERRMEKDAAMFDEFLKENHNNSVEALRIARKETSAKAKKITEIHGITTQIKKIQSDISRFEDTLEEYKMYRDILYQLSPREWQEEHRKRCKKRKDMSTEFRHRGILLLTFAGHSRVWSLLEQIQIPAESCQVCKSVPI
ncbi:CP100 protein, partial [Buphagus erythrorhynchus]|nr:CP100 protein [Buphagus erythrorhynchus]